jgi:ribosomal protein L11 methyltransferase
MAQLELAKAEIEKLKKADMGFDLGTLFWRERWVDMEDWANNWKTYYKPLEIGERLIVRPSWEKVEDPHGRIVLAMDPGMAFGTGEHHTTRMCLELLEACVKEKDRVLDIGCGSGILSIAALLMGASDATAVDIDPIARNVVADNRKLNDIADETYHLHIGDILTDTQLQETVAGSYDIVLANIVADVIIALAPQAARYCRPDGLFIVSGIIDTREKDVRECLEQNGFDVRQVKTDGGWVAMQAMRRREGL